MNATDADAPDLSSTDVPGSAPLPPVALVLGGATGMLGQALTRAAEAKGWTVRTLDGKNAAHYENTILITDGEPEILTAPAI